MAKPTGKGIRQLIGCGASWVGWEGKTPEKKPRFVFRIGDMALLSKNVLGEKSELMGDFNERCDFQHGGTRI